MPVPQPFASFSHAAFAGRWREIGRYQTYNPFESGCNCTEIQSIPPCLHVSRSYHGSYCSHAFARLCNAPQALLDRVQRLALKLACQLMNRSPSRTRDFNATYDRGMGDS